MPLTLNWWEIAVRLALRAVAGGVIGYNRAAHGRPAGLRTTLLVCLAACIAMVQMNLLLNVQGRTAGSFAVMDVMRLPLGILSGIGFIGAGAILRRGDLVVGVTTAATLWYVTVMGLCFGGGQIGLGLAALGLGIFVLWVLKWWEGLRKQECRASLVLVTDADNPGEEELVARLGAAGYRIDRWAVEYVERAQVRRLSCEVHWQGGRQSRPPEFVREMAGRPQVREIEWKPMEAPG